MYKAIFIDLDDTLWDCKQNALDAFFEVYETFKLSNIFNSFDHFCELYYPNNDILWQAYSEGAINKDKLNTDRFRYPFYQVGFRNNLFIDEFRNSYLTLVPTKSKLIEGAIDLLEHLKDKYPLYILSNGFTETQYTKIKSGGLNKYFEEVFLSDEIGYHKPSKEIFQFVLNKTEIAAEHALMVGDNIATDIIGAQKAMIDQIYFNPDNKQVNTYIPPTHIVSKLKEIKSII